MAGYIIELYKNIRSAEGYQPKGKTEDAREKQEYKSKTYITFGDFDRMALFKVEAFSRMRDMSKLSRAWIGDRQRLLLYELGKDNEVIYLDSDGKQGIYITSDKGLQLSEHLFIAVSILQFKESADRTKTDMKQCLNVYRENILALIKKKQREDNPVYASVLGTLGTYGLAIVWVSDQFVEILKMINYIKGTDVKENIDNVNYNFLSFFSIFAKNNLDNKMLNSKLDKVEGEAMLQVTLESNLNSTILQRFKEELQTTDFVHSAGEHDLIIKTECKNLYKLFENHNLLDPDEEFYKENILQTNVRLYDTVSEDSVRCIEEKKGALPETEENKNDISNALSEFVMQVENSYKDLRNLFSEKFPKTAGMVDSLDLLYSDFSSKISSVSNRMWAYDFGYQFLAILNVIKKYLEGVLDKTILVPTSEALSDFRDILSCYEYQIIHIAESNNLLIDTPKCHLRYTGQDNLTLYAYFGITKDVIKLCYLMQGKSRQSKITPLISVDVVPIIESTMYIDFGFPVEDKVLKLNFPMMALYNMPEYVPYLYHEIFHYVAPEDRVVRNWIKGVGLSIIAVRNLFGILLKTYSGIKDDKILDNVSTFVFLPEIYCLVCRMYYDEFAEEIRNENNEKYQFKETDERALEWRRYEQKLFYQLVNAASKQELIMPDSNIIFEVLVALYLKKDELEKKAESVLVKELDKDTVSDIVGGIERLMKELRGMAVNTNNEKKKVVYNELLKGTKLSGEYLLDMNSLIQVSTALSEVASDIPMVELAGMQPVHYMISYVKIQRDLLKDPDHRHRVQDYIRIGYVLDFLIGYDKSTEYARREIASYEEEFIQIYVGLYYSTKDIQKDMSECLEKQKDKAREWFSWINKAYVLYLKEYHIYSQIFKEMIGQISINGRKKDSAERKKYKEILDRIRDLKCELYYEKLRCYGAGIIRAIENLPSYQEENVKAEILSCKKQFSDELFKLNIQWIHAYQRQEYFKSIDESREKCSDTGTYKKDDLISIKKFYEFYPDNSWEQYLKRKGKENYQYEVRGIEELCRVTENVSQRFSRQDTETYGSRHHDIWYRGQSKTSYKLLPTAMRKYAQQKNRADSLRKFQREAYEEFKFWMDNASEKPDRTGYTVCDYLALMQHYGAPTIYMDWSENALSALYFALEAYIDPEKESEQNNDDAVLYMLHPNLYNKARNRIMDLAEENTGRDLDNYMRKTRQESTNSLPNLSVEYNKKKYCMFLLGEVEKEADIPDYRNRNFGTLTDSFNKEKYLYLPLAIYSSRANARVQAQFGMFMSYNIFTPLGEKNNFDYISLERIQDFFLDCFNDAAPFMYKIIINKGSKKRIAGWLRSIGVSKYMIYPELSKIGKRI